MNLQQAGPITKECFYLPGVAVQNKANNTKHIPVECSQVNSVSGIPGRSTLGIPAQCATSTPTATEPHRGPFNQQSTAQFSRTHISIRAYTLYLSMHVYIYADINI